MSAMSTNHQAALFESGASQPRRIWASRGAFSPIPLLKRKLATYACITCERKRISCCRVVSNDFFDFLTETKRQPEIRVCPQVNSYIVRRQTSNKGHTQTNPRPGQ